MQHRNKGRNLYNQKACDSGLSVSWHDPKVGFGMPWVRVRDDHEYWCAHGESPNADIERFASYAPAAARVGDLVLVLFHCSHEHFTYDSGDAEIYTADGQPFSTIGIDKEDIESGEHDEARYSLTALASFPTRFPAAYMALSKAAA
ncbi:hypothetical protein [Cupriavidus sp. TMH.W2]|uniref:hypothetical protein n=1 Tax=Cupriavidus sp. TMH.W2 TaxID=3434465 RepID=UPI003D77003D